MRNTWLALAIAGAVVPWLFFWRFFSDAGLLAFIPALFVNGAAGGFTADLLISSFVFWLFLWDRRTPGMWFYILLNLTIGLSCALPAWLYMEARRREMNDASQPVTG